MAHIIYQGHLNHLSPPTLCFDDPAIQFGALGFFETLRVESRVLHLFESHLARLNHALDHWRISWPCERDLLIEGIARELHLFPPDEQLRLRLSVGPQPNAEMNNDKKWPGRAFISAQPLPPEY